MVAFTAISNTEQPVRPGDNIRFNFMSSNSGDFDLPEGIFKCSTPGIYYFNFHISYKQESSSVIALIRNGAPILSVFKGPEPILDGVSNGAVLSLQAGDSVWLENVDGEGIVFSNKYGYTSFSGFLLG